MPLAVGARLGHYDVTDLIGEGGTLLLYGRVPTDAGVPNRLVMPRTLQSLT